MSTLKVENIQHPSSSTPAISLDSNGAMTGSFPYPNRNLIYNGAMQVHQRGTSAASITTSGFKTADRWQFFISSLGTWTQSVENDAPTGSGFSKSLKMLCTTADAAPAASDVAQVLQSLEGQDLQRIAKGTSDAQQLTLSFWVKSNVTGTYIAYLYDSDNARQACASYSVSASATWEKKTITFPADTSDALDNDNGASLQVAFALAMGSDRTSGTLQTTWADYVAANNAVGQTNIAAATNNYWQVTGVQLEVGDTATEFEHLPFGVELARCQRYFIALAQGADEYVALGQTFNDNGYGVVRFPTVMRAAPSAMSYSNLSHFSAWDAGTSTKTPLLSLQMDSPTPRGCRLPWNASGIGTSAMSTLRTNNAAAYVWISAEL